MEEEEEEEEDEEVGREEGRERVEVSVVDEAEKKKEEGCL